MNFPHQKITSRYHHNWQCKIKHRTMLLDLRRLFVFWMRSLNLLDKVGNVKWVGLIQWIPSITIPGVDIIPFFIQNKSLISKTNIIANF